MRFVLPIVSACLVASTAPALAQGTTSTAKPADSSVQAPKTVNKPASFFLEEVPKPVKAAPATSQPTKQSAKKKEVKAAKPAQNPEVTATTKNSLQERIEKQAAISPHFQQGLVMQSMGMALYAIKEYQDALKEDPKFISTYNNLAQCLIGRGEPGDKEEALRLLTEATKIDPNNIGTLHALAVLKESNNDNSGAQETYKKILAVQPLNMRAIANLSELYFRLGQKEQARAVIEGAIGQNPPEQQRSVFEEALKNLDKKPVENAKLQEGKKLSEGNQGTVSK